MIGCHQSVEYTYETREEYEQALRDMLDPAHGNSPSRACMAKKDLEAYDALVDEYLKFCEDHGE